MTKPRCDPVKCGHTSSRKLSLLALVSEFLRFHSLEGLACWLEFLGLAPNCFVFLALVSEFLRFQSLEGLACWLEKLRSSSQASALNKHRTFDSLTVRTPVRSKLEKTLPPNRFVELLCLLAGQRNHQRTSGQTISFVYRLSRFKVSSRPPPN